jgi:hypothetical protein
MVDPIEEKNNEIDFHQKRLENYRTYYIDGIFGGITPRGLLALECFIERKSTPTRIKYLIKDSGELGAETERDDETKGLLREIECGLIIDINTAKSLVKWLSQKIEEHKTLFQGGSKNVK